MQLQFSFDFFVRWTNIWIKNWYIVSYVIFNIKDTNAPLKTILYTNDISALFSYPHFYGDSPCGIVMVSSRGNGTRIDSRGSGGVRVTEYMFTPSWDSLNVDFTRAFCIRNAQPRSVYTCAAICFFLRLPVFVRYRLNVTAGVFSFFFFFHRVTRNSAICANSCVSFNKKVKEELDF